MTNTPRLDSIEVTGTFNCFERIRLADGHQLAIETRPGSGIAEVGLFPGLTAPDADGWEWEDKWEEWLTCGTLGTGGLYLDVPMKAVRDLIEQHGGEHPEQD